MKLKIGVIGSGEHFLKNIFPTLINNKNLEIVGILSKKKKFKNLTCYNEKKFYELKLDFVYIATPSKTHSKFIIKSLKKNINVLCEKPFCDNLTEFKIIKNLALKKNLLIFECFMYRFHPTFNFLKKIVSSKKYGKVKVVNSAFVIPPMNKKNNRYKKNLGGGFFLDLGVYLVSLQHYLFDVKFNKRNFHVATYRNNDKISLKGNICMKLEFLSFYHWGVGINYENFLEIVFDKAIVKVNRFFSKNKKEKSIINIFQNRNKEIIFKPEDHFKLMFDDVFKNYKIKSYKLNELNNIEQQLKNILKFKNEF